MAFFSSLLGGVFGQKLLGGLGGGIGGGIGGAIGQRFADLITPPQTAAQLGRDAASYYNNAFPGTNPWERLGSSQSSGVSERAIAKRQERATTTSANISASGVRDQANIHTAGGFAKTVFEGTGSVDAALDARRRFLGGVGVGDIKSLAAQKFPAELANLLADTDLKKAQAILHAAEGVLAGAKVPLADELAKAGLDREIAGSLTAWLYRSLGKTPLIGGYLQDHGPTAAAAAALFRALPMAVRSGFLGRFLQSRMAPNRTVGNDRSSVR